MEVCGHIQYHYCVLDTALMLFLYVLALIGLKCSVFELNIFSSIDHQYGLCPLSFELSVLGLLVHAD